MDEEIETSDLPYSLDKLIGKIFYLRLIFLSNGIYWLIVLFLM